MTLAPALARGVLAGLAAELVAVVVLSAVWFAMLGDAGADWDTGGFRVAVTITGAIVAVLAGAVGGAAGVVAARRAHPERASDLLVAGAAGPVVVGLVVPLAAALGSASLLASLLVAVALAGGGALGAIVAVRRGAQA